VHILRFFIFAAKVSFYFFALILFYGCFLVMGTTWWCN